MRRWRLIKSAPKEEDMPFLVLLPKNGVADFVVIQVTRFQGDLYPDHLDGNIDQSDAVTTATHWTIIPRPLPIIPLDRFPTAKLKARARREA